MAAVGIADGGGGGIEPGICPDMCNDDEEEAIGGGGGAAGVCEKGKPAVEPICASFSF